MIQKQLQEIGLNQNESEVYVSILQNGKCLPSRVAKETKINRTTVYSIIKKLSKMDMVIEDESSPYVHANEPKSLLYLLQKEKEELDKKAILIESLVKNLEILFARYPIYFYPSPCFLLYSRLK